MIKHLKSIKGAIPYIFVIFFNAIIDLGDKILLQNAIFKYYDGSVQIELTAFVNALIIIPGILLFTPSGYLSDRYSKSKVLHQASKVAFVLSIFTVASYFFGLFKVALFLTFLLAAQSAIFFPAKYGLIKEIFGKDRLPEGNGIVQATTIIAILLSSLLFSVIFENMISGNENSVGEYLHSVWPATLILVVLAYFQVQLTKNVPVIEEGDSNLKIDKKKYLSLGYLKENLSIAFKNRVIVESIVGLGLFYGISQVMLAIFGVHLENYAHEHNTIIAQGIMSLAGVGIAIGAMLTAYYSKDYIETGLIPVGIVGVAGSIFLITSSSSTVALSFEFLAFGIFGGFILVVLNSLIQYRSSEHELGRVMAASNLVQNIFMLLFLTLTVFWTLNHFDTKEIFMILASIASIALLYTLITLPQFLLRFIFKFIAMFRYKLTIQGVENFPKDGAALLLGNHVSWIDWMVLAIASPRRVSFVIERDIYERWYLKPIFKFFGLIPISSRASKSAFDAIKQKLNEGKIVALFPEGAISRNGHLGEFKRGYEKAVEGIDVPIVPFYIRGLWGSRFSYADKKQKENVKNRPRDVGVIFGKTLPSKTKTDELKQKIFELQIESWHSYVNTLPPLPNAWLDMAKREGGNFAIADATGTKLSASKFAAVVKSFADIIDEISKGEQNIGIVLPPSVGGAIVNMATLMLGKTIVNLNYTANKVSIEHAINMANIKTIYTSKQFLTKLKAKGFDIEEILNDTNLIFVEDIKAKIKKSQVIKNLLTFKLLPASLLQKLWVKKIDSNDTAAILFSSGSEGTPKGIELNHQNFMGNIRQFGNVLNFKKDDVMLASLPIFHVFGLTVTLLAPLIEGVPFVAQPDPTDALGVGKLVAKFKVTLLFGTSTFFRIYTKNRKLLPIMFGSVRFVVGGAEKISNDVREAFKKKFGLEIYEAYGATEATPGISANIPDALNTDYWTLQVGHKVGTVGMPFPGSACKIVDPESLEELPRGEDGMIIVGGPQIMKGYLNDIKKTNEVIIQKDGKRWYITGDKGHIDEDGFLTIVDRYSRFAKIGGEMISLGAVEEAIREILPEDIDIVAANVPDPKKGEAVVLLYHGDIEVDDLKELIKKSNLNPLMIPSHYFRVEEMPKLGSGKSDLKLAKKLALELCGL
jgi:acyl-[acyl-carrier-protein]-phospholipid O-acyltransferase/long-chain-fatty-acid--[acyl-carrier-protein] ligase